MSARRIAVTGASGLIGRALVPALHAQGWHVVTVGRGAGSEVRWNPAAGTIDARGLDGVEAVVHLAGEPIAVRWSDARRRAIRSSRDAGTQLIARTLAGFAERPRVLVSASAVGFYGDGGDAWLDEGHASGGDFLAAVCVAWERAADAARDAGIRVVHPRIGIVLAADGGALGKLVPLFRFALGGPVGGGRQWMSWITRTDLVRVLLLMLDNGALTGAVNAVSPQPVTNAEFAQTLGRVLHRPARIPVPAVVLRAAFGDMARQTLLASQRVRPARLADAGFHWDHPALDGALRAVLRGGA